MSDNEIMKNIQFKIADLCFEWGDNEDGICYDPIEPIDAILCAHLKLFLSSIIQIMVQYKRKYLLFCPLLNKKVNPAVPRSRSISTQVVYEKTPFSARDFLHLLKNNQHLIPRRHLYHAYIARLSDHKSLRPSLPKEEVEES